MIGKNSKALLSESIISQSWNNVRLSITEVVEVASLCGNAHVATIFVLKDRKIFLRSLFGFVRSSWLAQLQKVPSTP